MPNDQLSLKFLFEFFLDSSRIKILAAVDYVKCHQKRNFNEYTSQYSQYAFSASNTKELTIKLWSGDTVLPEMTTKSNVRPILLFNCSVLPRISTSTHRSSRSTHLLDIKEKSQLRILGFLRQQQSRAFDRLWSNINDRRLFYHAGLANFRVESPLARGSPDAATSTWWDLEGGRHKIYGEFALNVANHSVERSFAVPSNPLMISFPVCPSHPSHLHGLKITNAGRLGSAITTSHSFLSKSKSLSSRGQSFEQLRIAICSEAATALTAAAAKVAALSSRSTNSEATLTPG
ncbi:hypothetical protein HZH68_011606 [Vespula germanica]|uniref:Uncharacterized protein n=1 Tax=Vespula germanica TaxID=30212 RepID=A0A834JNV6_VESGE|nr:hypothetical protein HZH68_011606 [Vespula germanica]